VAFSSAIATSKIVVIVVVVDCCGLLWVWIEVNGKAAKVINHV
jgi:hypothetical protein